MATRTWGHRPDVPAITPTEAQRPRSERLSLGEIGDMLDRIDMAIERDTAALDRAHADHKSTLADLDTRLSEDVRRQIVNDSLARLREAEAVAQRDLSNLRQEVAAAWRALDRLTPASVISDDLAARTATLVPILGAEYALLEVVALADHLDNLEAGTNTATLAALRVARTRLLDLRTSTSEPTVDNPFGLEREILRRLEDAVGRLADPFRDTEFASEERDRADAISDITTSAQRRISKAETERGDNVEQWLGPDVARDRAGMAGA